MRFTELSLLAYGAFQGRRLDFSSQDLGLHLIYGENEAGKSTTLRAIVGLLYGIDRQSPDAQLLGGPNLRIGAKLVDRNGRSLSVVRRKGRKNTLLDEAGDAVDEAPLSRMLQGLQREQFSLMFGLDHESLREGGAQLESGRGDLGESLFQAGLGGASIHSTLRALHDEADALFTPRGKLRALNEAIKGYEEARRRMRDHTTRADAWRENRKALEAHNAKAAEKQRERQALMAEQSRLQRARRVRPKLAKRRELLARRAELGEVPALGPHAAEQRRLAQRELASCETAIRELRQHEHKLAQRRASLDIPASLVAVGADVVSNLRDRLGNHRKAAQDLPRRRGELRALDSEASSAMRALGRRVRLQDAESLRVDRATETRIMRLAKEHSGIHERCQNALTRLTDAREALEQCKRQRAQLPAPAELGPLAGLLARIRAAGDVEGRLSELRREGAALGSKSERELTTLGRFTGTLEQLCSATLPDAETIESFAERLAELSQQEQRLDKEQRAAHGRKREVEQALSTLQHEGAPPSELDLEQARQARQRAWQSVRKASDEEREAASDAFEDALRSADLVADRLRREASRVSDQARLLAEQEALSQALDGLRQLALSLREHKSQLDSQWSSLWHACGVEAGEPTLMRRWRSTAQALCEQAERRAQLQSIEASLTQQRDELANAAARMLGASDEVELTALGARLEQALRSAESQQQQAAQLARQQLQLEGELDREQRRSDEAAERLADWRTQWAELMEKLQLPADASVEEVQAELTARSQLFSKLDAATQMRGRIEGIERDAKAFSQDVHRTADQHLFGLGADRTVEEIADDLVQRYEQARSDLAQQKRIDEDLAEARGKLEALTRRAGEAQQQLAALQHAAGVGDVEALELVERRAAEAARVDGELSRLEDEVLAEGDGAGLQELEQQSAALDADHIGPRLLEIEQALELLDEEQRKAHHAIGGLTHGLQVMESDEQAAEAATEAEAQLSRVKEYARAYVQKRLAAHLLEREIHAYREQNQGPIVSRASDLFARLTLGHYQRLGVGYHVADKPVLQCIGDDGRTVGVPALSDGTRDQLYLALRLASLERFFAHAEPMPLILDDVLIHFDERRAAAALEVLGEFATHTQVLFFTHNARLLEIARSAIAPGRLCEHRLEGDRAPAPAVSVVASPGSAG